MRTLPRGTAWHRRKVYGSVGIRSFASTKVFVGQTGYAAA